MEIKLNLTKEYDVVTLFQLLGNEKTKYTNDNFKHMDMISLLEGNNDNEKAKCRLEHERHCMRLNNEKIKFIDNLMSQLEPLVDKHFQSIEE